MKRENILISEDPTTKRVAATKFTAPGNVPAFDCSIHFGEQGNDVTLQNCIIEDNALVKCSPEDAYDFETGALIALMKMCGVEKVKKAAKETFFEVAENSVNEYEEKMHALEKEIKRLNNVSEGFYKFNSRLIDEIDQKNHEIISLKEDSDKVIDELIEENEKLKLDCKKLQHGYLDTDMIFCGGRQNGKQYTFLVELFKKLDQKKVDAAYKEAYNTTLPVWQKEALRQAYEIRKEPKGKTELPRTLDINGTIYRKSIQIKDFGEQISKLTAEEYIKQDIEFTRKCVDEWFYKPPTKREEMWAEIFAIHKKDDVIIRVKREDISAFLHEIENKFPKITWASGVKILKPKGIIKDIYELLKLREVGYFRLSKYTKLSYSIDPDVYRYKDLHHIDYLPPMRWDLFKKGRIVVGVKNNYELGEFRKEVEVNTGIKNIPMCPTNLCLFYSFDKDNYKIILESVEKPNIAKINGHKVYYWEDVR